MPEHFATDHFLLECAFDKTLTLTRHLPSSCPVLHTYLMQIADLSDDDPLKFYLRELATVQPLTSDETTELLKQMRSGSDRAEDAEKRLIEANLSLVVAIAERFRSHGCPMLDLIQKGNESLLLALKSFTGESSDSFSDYAASC